MDEKLFIGFDLSTQQICLLNDYRCCCYTMLQVFGSVYQKRGKIDVATGSWRNFFFRTTHEIQANFIGEEQKQRSSSRSYQISSNMLY